MEFPDRETGEIGNDSNDGVRVLNKLTREKNC